jgi:V8-like Glu-specific endopeptidase
MQKAFISGLCLGVSALGLAALSTPALANTTVQKTLLSEGTPAPASGRNAVVERSRMPMLPAGTPLPAPLGASGKGIAPSAFGAQRHPFTTKRAAASQTAEPVNRRPFSASGKLWMRFGTSSWFVCSATMVKKGIAVTAAHCVHNFGQGNGGFPTRVIFEPARNGATLPFGWYQASAVRVPTVYWNGSDTCTVSGVVCENDVAVVTLRPNGVTWPGTLTGLMGYTSAVTPFTSFAGLTATQITQLGYPVSLDEGRIMQRTDSLGYKAAPSNVIIGSDMTGGSSGGPWVVNLGVSAVRSSGNTAPTFDTSNVIIGTTSWGYTSTNQDVQGASLFSRNTKFTTAANIDKLMTDACASTPTACAP